LTRLRPTCYHLGTMIQSLRADAYRQTSQQAIVLVLLARAWPVASPAG